MNRANILDDIRTIKRFDRSDMLDILTSFPGQCRSGAALGEMAFLPVTLKKIKFKNIVCTGLGGSAIGADIARSYLAGSLDLPIVVNRDYLLPEFVDSGTLLIVSSYSGNTEETISAYKDGRKRGARIVVITSGGRIKEMADRDGYPVSIIPGGFPPRTALGYSFFILLSLLCRLGIIKRDISQDIKGAIDGLAELEKESIGFSVRHSANVAKKTAMDIYGKLPVIYSPQSRFDAVATRWKGQFAENAKTLSLANVFPEMNHNEIMGWANPAEALKKAVAVFLRDSSEHPRVRTRMDITRKMLMSEGFEVLEVRSRGRGVLERIFSLIYIGDFTSYYLSILNKEDPTSIKRIDYLKKELARR